MIENAQSLMLAFTAAKDIDAKTFYGKVNSDAAEVAAGIAAILTKYGPVKVQQAGDRWVIAFGNGRMAQVGAPSSVAETRYTTRITVIASTADLPPVITALNAFFGNWPAVAGLIATGAAVVGGIVALGVIRRS